MTQHYIALVHQDSSSIGISFPDFPGCITAVDSIDDIVTASTEALSLHIEGMISDNEPIPEPTAISSTDLNDAKMAILIPAPVITHKVRRINITVDERLISRIDAEARYLGMNRSAFLSEGARRMIKSGG